MYSTRIRSMACLRALIAVHVLDRKIEVLPGKAQEGWAAWLAAQAKDEAEAKTGTKAGTRTETRTGTKAESQDGPPCPKK